MAKKLQSFGDMNRLRYVSLVVAAGVAVTMGAATGCSTTSSDQEDPAVVAQRNAAGSELQGDLNAVEQKYETCAIQLAQTGTCVLPGDTTSGVPGVVIVDPTIQDFPNPLAAAQQKIDQIKQVFAQIGNNICDVIGPFASLNHPYFYYGASAQAGIIGQVQGGMDVVWDMTNLQTAAFGYKGYGAGSLIGGEAGVYAGYGFGNKTGVLDAWSGRFCTATGSIGLPAKLLSANASAFVSPDMSVYGGSVGVSAGLDAIPTPVDGSVFAADWGAWDGATKGLSQKGWFINQTLKTDPATGKQYIQYASAKDMALALLWNAPPPLGITAAAQVIALDIQKRTGLTIDKMCPQQSANQSTPAVLKAVGNACGALPALGGSGGSDGGSSGSTGSGGSGNGGTLPDGAPAPIVDSGTPDVVIKDSCQGKADGLYCSELNDFSAYQCKSGSIAGGQQCPGTQKCGGPNGAGTTIVCD